jgi:hypothetical protein
MISIENVEPTLGACWGALGRSWGTLGALFSARSVFYMKSAIKSGKTAPHSKEKQIMTFFRDPCPPKSAVLEEYAHRILKIKIKKTFF